MFDTLLDRVSQLHPVIVAVLSAFLGILGVLVIRHPVLLVWTLGIGFILLGVALIATLFVQPRQ